MSKKPEVRQAFRRVITKARRFIKSRLAFWVYLLSGPVLCIADAFLYGWDERWNSDAGFHFIVYLFIYFLVLPVIFVVGLIRSWRKALLGLATTILMVGLFIVLQIGHSMAAIGFYCAIYPQNAYIREHCHPISFRQDGHAYAFGVCDGAIDSDGRTSIHLIYDTSGDTLYDGVHDRKEWVDVVRKFYNDDPNDELENVVGDTNQIYGPFYFIWFEDEDSSGGFSYIYGPPPPNIKNHFQQENVIIKGQPYE